MPDRVVPECATCYYSRAVISDEEDEGPILKCHRFPPLLFVFEDEIIQAFPDADEWCGEYKEG